MLSYSAELRHCFGAVVGKQRGRLRHWAFCQLLCTHHAGLTGMRAFQGPHQVPNRHGSGHGPGVGRIRLQLLCEVSAREWFQILKSERTPIEKLRMWYMIPLQAFILMSRLRPETAQSHFFVTLLSCALTGDNRVTAVL